MVLNVGLVGPGGIAENALLPALRQVPGARLWSVASRDLGRARDCARRHGAAAAEPAHDRIETLLADPELDALIIATPDRLHAEQTVAAAEAGKHVLVEKPMATDADSARAMVRACREAGVTFGVAYHMRWHAGHRRLHERVRAGAIGTIRQMRVQWTLKADDNANWRASPALGRWWSLAGVGTHCLDQILWFLGPSGGAVTALRSSVSRPVWGGPHDEQTTITLSFESGAQATLCSSVLYRAPGRLEVYGSEGFAICEDTMATHGGGRIELKREPFPFEPRNPYEGEIADFVEAVGAGRDPEVNGEAGLRNVELLLEADP